MADVVGIDYGYLGTKYFLILTIFNFPSCQTTGLSIQLSRWPPLIHRKDIIFAIWTCWAMSNLSWPAWMKLCSHKPQVKTWSRDLAGIFYAMSGISLQVLYHECDIIEGWTKWKILFHAVRSAWKDLSTGTVWYHSLFQKSYSNHCDLFL